MNTLTSVCRIPEEIDFHGKAIGGEIAIMADIVDNNGKNIQREMEKMRLSFEKEMQTLNRKTRNTVLTVVAINIASRLLIR
ncbi:hypothetical protein ATCVBr0604L_741R [Acanthocystis turfacea Chlorella virus Br0604L]|nr:hypothetical protein ATCVBr0604L_741R [Acanthocystis turfacea Chlorella virus Br0604L]